jgi:hypothetical protein
MINVCLANIFEVEESKILSKSATVDLQGIFSDVRGVWASGQFPVSCFDSLHACWKVSCSEEFHASLF